MGKPVGIADDLLRLLKSYERRLDRLEAAPDVWHVIGAAGEPGFTNSWVYYGSSVSVPAFKKLATGLVVIKGVVKSGTVNTIFTLPEGYRPLEQTLFHCAAYATDVASARVDVNTNGTVTVVDYEGTVAGNSYISLSGIVFLAEQ